MDDEITSWKKMIIGKRTIVICRNKYNKNLQEYWKFLIILTEQL